MRPESRQGKPHQRQRRPGAATRSGSASANGPFGPRWSGHIGFGLDTTSHSRKSGGVFSSVVNCASVMGQGQAGCHERCQECQRRQGCQAHQGRQKRPRCDLRVGDGPAERRCGDVGRPEIGEHHEARCGRRQLQLEQPPPHAVVVRRVCRARKRGGRGGRGRRDRRRGEEEVEQLEVVVAKRELALRRLHGEEHLQQQRRQLVHGVCPARAELACLGCIWLQSGLIELQPGLYRVATWAT